MPLSTGQELKGALPHKVGAWYEAKSGAIFRFNEDPVRLYERPDELRKTGEPPDPIRHHAEVELLSGLVTHLVWRWEDTRPLGWAWQVMPVWLLRLLKREAPTGLPPVIGGTS